MLWQIVNSPAPSPANYLTISKLIISQMRLEIGAKMNRFCNAIKFYCNAEILHCRRYVTFLARCTLELLQGRVSARPRAARTKD